MSDYPEHDKLRELEDRAAEVQGFLDWLDEQGIVLAVYKRQDVGTGNVVVESNRLNPASWFEPGKGHFFEKIMARYFDIDMEKIRAEKEQMYEQIKEMNRR